MDGCFRSFRKADETESWILDSSASRHVRCRRKWFSEFASCGNKTVYPCDGLKYEIRGIGNVFIKRLLSG